MKKRNGSSLAFIILFLVLSLIIFKLSFLPSSNVSTKFRVDNITRPVVLVDFGHVNTHQDEMNGIITNLNAWGYDVIKGIEVFSEEILRDVDILMIAAPANENSNFTPTELAAIRAWFNSGDKSIWVAGDSDYFTSAPIKHANAILETIDSAIYCESGAIESKTNAGAVYRVLAPEFNMSHPICQGVEHVGVTDEVLFHGPCPVIGFNGINYVALEEKENIPENVQIIVKCNGMNNGSWYRRWSDGLGYEVHQIGANASYVMMAIETNAGVAGTGTIIVSGEVIWSDYLGMFAPPPDYLENNGYHVDNYIIVKNTLHWLELPPPNPGSIIKGGIPNEIFNFIAYGDTRDVNYGFGDAREVHHNIVNRYMLCTPELVLHTGDMVCQGGRYEEWEPFNQSIAPVWDAGIPFYGAIGNHETYLDEGLFENYTRFFDYSAVINTPGENERWYSFDYEGVHFISLNTEEDIINGEFTCSTEQMDWLLYDLSTTKTEDIIVVIFHRPCYSVNPGHETEAITIRDDFHDLFIQYDVDIVFNGHDHHYYRTLRNNIYYVTTGGGGAPLALFEDMESSSTWQEGDVGYIEYHFCNVMINSTNIVVDVRALNGSSLDFFAINPLNSDIITTEETSTKETTEGSSEVPSLTPGMTITTAVLIMVLISSIIALKRKKNQL
ncbi:MAG: metallophosphoesterase [Candidatus Thorarchaeota archaeon]